MQMKKYYYAYKARDPINSHGTTILLHYFWELCDVKELPDPHKLLIQNKTVYIFSSGTVEQCMGWCLL
jgi:hypothetical protein